MITFFNYRNTYPKESIMADFNPNINPNIPPNPHIGVPIGEGSGPKIGSPLITGKFSPTANLRPDARLSLGLLESRPLNQTPAAIFKAIRATTGDIAFDAGNLTKVQGGLASKVLSDEFVAGLAGKPRPVRQAVEGVRQALRNFDIDIDAFNAKTAAGKATFLKDYGKAVESAAKTIGKLARKNPALLGYHADLRELGSQLRALGSTLANRGNLDYSQLQHHKTPALQDVWTALDTFWTRQDEAMNLHNARGNFAGLSLDNRIEVAGRLQTELGTLVRALDTALGQAVLKDDVAVLQALKDAANAKLGALAGLMHDEMRSISNMEKGKIEPFTKARDTIQKQLDSLDARIATTRGDLDALENQSNTLRQRLGPEIAELRNFRNSLSNRNTRLSFPNNAPQMLKNVLHNNNIAATMRNKTKILDVLNSMIQSRNDKLNHLDTQIRDCTDLYTRQTARRGKLDDVVTELTGIKGILEAKTKDGRGTDMHDAAELALFFEDSFNNLTALYRTAPTVLNNVLDHLQDLREEYEKLAVPLQPNALGLQTLVESRGRGTTLDAALALHGAGMREEDLLTFGQGFDSVLEKNRIPLGKGAFNSVFKVEWENTDGVTQSRAVKDETLANRGFSSSPVGNKTGVTKKPGTAARNLTTALLAGRLNMQSLAPKPDIFMDKGKLALAMQVGKGTSLEHCKDKIKNDQIKELRLAKELCKLEWLDALVGQMDRHWGNYLVNVDGGDVSVTAIDNDLCLGSLQFEPGLVPVDPNDLNQGYVDVTEYKHGLVNKKDDFYPDGNVDVYYPKYYKQGNPNQVEGAHTIGYPALIDRETFEAIAGQGVTFQTFVGDAGKHLGPDELAALESRFDALRAHALELQKAGLVVYNWETWTVPRDMDRTPSSLMRGVPPNTQPLSVTGGSNAVEFLFTCGSFSYFNRDVYEESI